MICTILTDGTKLNGICRNEEEPPLLTVRSRLFTLMQTLIAQGYDEFWLNGEYGIPLWAAEFLLKLRVGNPITVHIAVPYEEQSTNWTEDVRDRYFTVHEEADEVKMVGTQFTADCYETADRYRGNQATLNSAKVGSCDKVIKMSKFRSLITLPRGRWTAICIRQSRTKQGSLHSFWTINVLRVCPKIVTKRC